MVFKNSAKSDKQCIVSISEEHEATYGGNNMDPTTLSINTVRGKAMHAVIRYGWWMKPHFEEDGQQFSFDQMSEVRTILERHLDLQHDPSKAIRSVYGQFIPSLYQFDQDWLKDHFYDIFSTENEHLDYFLAAWNSYIAFNKPYNDVLEIMAPVYALAKCRFVHDRLTDHLKDLSSIKEADKLYSDNQSRREMSKEDRMLLIRNSVRHFTHLSHHPEDDEEGEEVVFTRKEAETVLGLTAAMASFYFKI